jgi:hypothetical protein
MLDNIVKDIKGKKILLVFKKIYLLQYKENILELMKNNEVTFLSFAYNHRVINKLYENAKIIKFENIEEQLKMKFDYIIGNPPFTGPQYKKSTNGAYPIQDNNLWQKIIELCIPLAKIEMIFIGPKGLVGKFWKKHKNNIVEAERLDPKTFNIGHETSRIHYKINPTEKEKKYCTFILSNKKYIVEKSKYPKRVPIIRNNGTLEEYDEVFDQLNGIKQIDSDGNISGILRDKDKIIFLEKVPKGDKCYPMSYEDSKKIIPKFQKLMDEGKIHGYYGRGFRKAMRDFDELRYL